MNPRGMSSAAFGAGSAASLTDLFETDALLDALGRRDPVHSGAAEAPEIRLLRALVSSVDSDIRIDLEADPDPIAVAALAAGFELAGSTELDIDEDAASAAGGTSRHRAFLTRAGGASRLQLVGGTAGRRLRRHRPFRFIAVVAGVAIALGGGSLAAAATTDPAHAWGPLRPLADALHPGWQADFFAAKREAIMRTLDRATQQSQAGDRVAAAVTYGTAKQQARELPSGPDARLLAKFDAVAQQLGLGPSGQSATTGPSPVVSGVAGGPTAGTLPTGSPPTTGDPSTDPASAPPVAGSPPATTGDPTSADPGTDTSGASTDPSSSSGGAATGSTPAPVASPSPAPSPLPTDPGSGDGSGSTSGSISGSVDGSTAGSVDGSTAGSTSSSTDSTGPTGSAGSPSASGSASTGSMSSADSSWAAAGAASAAATDAVIAEASPPTA